MNKQLLILLLIALPLLASCDYSARSDLRAMDKAMKDAEENNADMWAETEWKRAQASFNEAQALAHDRKINEARDKALEARTYAEEALELTLARKKEMEEERDRLGTYRP